MREATGKFVLLQAEFCATRRCRITLQLQRKYLGDALLFRFLSKSDRLNASVNVVLTTGILVLLTNTLDMLGGTRVLDWKGSNMSCRKICDGDDGLSFCRACGKILFVWI